MNVPYDKIRIEKLTQLHDTETFDCGIEALNQFVRRYALQNQRKDGAQTWAALVGNRLVGYYTLTVGAVEIADAPERLRKGLPKHPVPVMILARLAVSKDRQGKRIGQGLLADALRRTMSAADIAGIRAILVHAKDEAAACFYRHFGFSPFPEAKHTLYWLLKDIRVMLHE
ncbi:MAG: GNAT family N-acetyltransferase [Rickettsiales bacterium]